MWTRIMWRLNALLDWLIFCKRNGRWGGEKRDSEGVRNKKKHFPNGYGIGGETKKKRR